MEILKSSKLKVLESILRRLPENDSDYNFYKEMFILHNKGYIGEQQVTHMWKEINLPSPHYLFYNYEFINHAGNSHQIDTLLLTPNFIWILEVKNISGRIDIDEFKHQLIRTNFDGTIDSFRNPIDQIKRHYNFLNRKLNEINIKLPIEYAIIIVKDSTIIGTVPQDIPIFHASGLQSELERITNKHREKKISPHHVEKIKIDFMNMYHRKVWKPKVNPNKLRKGVLCHKCDFKSVMVLNNGNFKCPNCKFKSKYALLEAMYDYRCLISEWITNSELRDYLFIESRHAAKRILKNLNMEQSGTYRDRKYKIPDFFDITQHDQVKENEGEIG